MALYASIPFMIGHNVDNTVGLFWLNAAEGWIDVKKGGQGILGSLSNMMSGGGEKDQVNWPTVIYLYFFLSQPCFQLGTSSMNSKLTGEGDVGVVGVQKKPLQFLTINSEFWA